MLAESELYQLLTQLPEEALAAVFILGVIFSFATIIVTVISFAVSFRSVRLAQLSKDLIEELIAKGYTPQEITALVHGPNRWSKIQELFTFARNRTPFHCRHDRYPAPPVKQTVV